MDDVTEAVDPTLLPTDEDVAFYRTHGYWISPPIIPDEVIDTAERGMERLYAGESDHTLPDGTRHYGWNPGQGDVLRKNDYASLLIEELAKLVRHPQVAATAARLASTDEIRLWHDQLLYKPSEQSSDSAPVVGWHTDRQYWRTCSSASMLTAWVPFHDVDLPEGPISFVDGSHAWDEDVVLDFFDQDLSSLDRLRGKYDVSIRPARIPRGAMSFHHCRTIHGSGPNRSGKPRRSIAIHLQPGDNQFVEHTREDGSRAEHGNDRYVGRTNGGHPDYSDPAFCPVLWSA